MLNLILNGNEAMSSPGWETRDLLLRSEKSEPDRVLVTVQDTGIGFNPKDEERVSTLSLLARKAVWGSDFQSVARSSRTMAESFGPSLTRAQAHPFSSACQQPSKTNDKQT